MPTLTEVSDPDNLDRLSKQLSGMDTIIALSEPAVFAVQGAGLRAAYSHKVHPSMRGLNNRFTGLGTDVKNRQWRVGERCRLYAEELVQSFQRLG